MKNDPLFLRKKVEARLKELGRSQTEAARIGELEPDFLRDILRNRKRSVHGTNLHKLAKALDWEPADILDQPKTRIDPSKLDDPIYVVGEISAGVWIDVTAEYVDQEGMRRSPFPPDPRFPIEAQFDFVVRGSSINNFAREGQRIRCVSLDAYSWPLENNDMVVVERHRGDLRERTAKRYRLTSSDKPELWPDSDDPRWQEPVPLEIEEDSADRVQIIAVVLYVYDHPRPWSEQIYQRIEK